MLNLKLQVIVPYEMEGEPYENSKQYSDIFIVIPFACQMPGLYTQCNPGRVTLLIRDRNNSEISKLITGGFDVNTQPDIFQTP